MLTRPLVLLSAFALLLAGGSGLYSWPEPEISPLRVGGKPPAPVLNIAHRGARAFAPENTIESFKKAIEIGCDMIELDVHFSQDKKLIIVHDDDLLRRSNVKEKFPNRKTYFVSDFDAAEIRKLDAGSWFVKELGKLAGERESYLKSLTAEEIKEFIGDAAMKRFESREVRHPELHEVLELAKKKKCMVNIEIKTIPRQYPGITARVVKLVKDLKMEREVIISSFDHEALVEVRRSNAVIATAALVSDRLYDPGRYVGDVLKADAYNPGCYGEYDVLGFNSVSGKLYTAGIQSARYAGLGVNVWTENNPERMKQLIDVGVTGIITDYPNRLRDVLKKMDEPKK